MGKLRRVELSEVIAELPDLQTFNPKMDSAKEMDDLFLCALGFEERCLTLPRLLSEAGYRSKLAVYCVYSTNPNENEGNREALVGYLSAFGGNVQSLQADAPDFTNELRSLIQNIMGEVSSTCPRVTFDISVAANRLLVKCMKILLESNIRARVLYSEAAIYHPTKHEYEKNPEEWMSDEVLGLERGVSDVVVSADHPGLQLDTLPDCVVLFPTFKAERSRTVIDKVDPSLVTDPGGKVQWLLGVPHLAEDRWRLEAMREINGIAEEIPHYQVSTFQYKDTLETLEAIHGKMSDDHNISISPIGSKMQGLGTSLFHYLRPDVRIVFAAPKEYNAAQYSEGCKETWKIELGSIPDLRERLDKVGTLAVED